MSAPGIFRLPPPTNEPVHEFAPGSPEREALKAKLDELQSERIELPLVIGGEETRTGETTEVVMPHRTSHVLADMHQGGPAEVDKAIKAAGEAWQDWSRTPWEERAAVLLRAAELLAGPWRMTLNAATMLGQSKTAHQAEIDAACELIDFWRFNPTFMTHIYEEQPISSPGQWNRMEYRPLEGFVFAVTPFNFTAIGGNLPTSAALMGNTVVWKPATTAAYSAHFLMQILREAGLPDGVINLVYGPGARIGDAALASPDLAGIHFTGSTGVFQSMWRTIGNNIERYRNYPRIVGETGGKDFILAHPSADVDAVATAILRGSFEYQGQKCSAASRVFVPQRMWPELKERLVEQVGSLTMGDVTDFGNFMGAVIDANSFRTQKEAIEEARADGDSDVLVGGDASDEGRLLRPADGDRDPQSQVPAAARRALRACRDRLRLSRRRVAGHARGRGQGSPFGLTGAIFSRERAPIEEAQDKLEYAAGNLYINDKPTGAVVGQQPFGGARASGTNDKAGSMWNLIRWVSPRTIKETFVPPTDYRYPFMDPDTAGT